MAITGTRLTLAFVTLLVLTALTFGLSYVPLGSYEVLVAMLIAAVKATVVGLYFMHLAAQRWSNRIVFATAVIFVAILTGLTAADIWTRPTPALSPPAIHTDQPGD